MKDVWLQCWDEFSVWFCSQWKYAWSLLSESLSGLIVAVFEWAKTIVGSALGGAWKLIIKPVGKWCCDKIVEWIKKI